MEKIFHKKTDSALINLFKLYLLKFVNVPLINELRIILSFLMNASTLKSKEIFKKTKINEMKMETFCQTEGDKKKAVQGTC